MFIRATITKNQSGAALIVSMIMLLLLTIIGVTGMKTTALEERMAGNMRDKALAFESAEAALRDAEAFMETVFTLGAFNSDGSDGYYDNSVADLWREVDWSGSDGSNTKKAVTVPTSIPGVEPGQYIIEYISDSEDEDVSGGVNLSNIGQGTGAGNTSIFRVTARGTGASGTSAVIIQSIYGRKL